MAAIAAMVKSVWRRIGLLGAKMHQTLLQQTGACYGLVRRMTKVRQTVLDKFRSPELVPKHFLEKGDGAGEDFFLAAGDEVVFSVDFDQGGPVAVGFKVLFAAPHGDDGVLGSMEQQDRALVCGGRAVDVQLLGVFFSY